jgi:hypothetical protein
MPMHGAGPTNIQQQIEQLMMLLMLAQMQQGAMPGGMPMMGGMPGAPLTMPLGTDAPGGEIPPELMMMLMQGGGPGGMM